MQWGNPWHSHAMGHSKVTDADSKVPSSSFVLLSFPPRSWGMQYIQPNLQHAEVIEFSIFSVELASEDIKCCTFQSGGGQLGGKGYPQNAGI